MTHSPATSEDEERHSASECPEGGSESDSSPDGPGQGPRGTRGQGSGTPGSLASARGLQGRSMSVPDDAHFSMMVFRIGIPDLHQTKCLRFNPDATIWTAKQQVLCALSESLQDVLNYGLFQPATSGRDANFLEEERLLREYPQSFEKGVPYLEFRYKTRVYKQTNLDEKQLAKLHTKTGLKKFLEYVQLGTSDKVARLLDKGLDPNYHDSDSGETPLTLAAQTEGSVEVIRTLCLGGAHIDFRARDGMTALHKAACARHCLALTALLDLGGSPNYKDRRGLTPLFHTAMVGGDPRCCELLLYNRAQLGIADENGWQEIHQVPASGATLSTWNTCSSMGLSLEPRMPRGTQPCTSVLSTTRSDPAGPSRLRTATSPVPSQARGLQPPHLHSLCSSTVFTLHPPSFHPSVQPSIYPSNRYRQSAFPVSGPELGAGDSVLTLWPGGEQTVAPVGTVQDAQSEVTGNPGPHRSPPPGLPWVEVPSWRVRP
ncbi:hypothetical protein GHT09_014672 [Marmota monax]|uniref:Talin N-terminal F0 domain-containing protein n=1 Tax=Marmota monax TaxID=9995 RepID=A0A834UWL3_MARMO|nr:hypothetical protein GHT09_014672 [Marmota monax]